MRLGPGLWIVACLAAGCDDKAGDSGEREGSDDSGATDTDDTDDTASGNDDTAIDDSGGTGEGDGDGDGWTVEEGDCDDADAEQHPEALEACNEADDDCDGAVDEEAGGTWYVDADGDGYGNADETVQSCETPTGVADNGADCDDDDPDEYPGAEEVADGEDDDCDGEIDEDVVAFEVEVTWSAAGVEVGIAGGTDPWRFGMAETGVGAVGWFGETCIPGDEPRGYEDYGYDLCHPLDAGGGFLPSVYPDIYEVADDNTLFNEEIGASGDLTYVLFDTTSSACWVWGDDVAYYDGFGCTEW